MLENIQKRVSHTAPETSDQISKDDKNALQELEAKEVQKKAGN